MHWLSALKGEHSLSSPCIIESGQTKNNPVPLTMQHECVSTRGCNAHEGPTRGNFGTLLAIVDSHELTHLSSAGSNQLLFDKSKIDLHLARYSGPSLIRKVWDQCLLNFYSEYGSSD